MRRMFGFQRKAPTTDRVSRLTLTHAGETIHVTLKRAPTARRFTLRVRFAARDAVLTMPQRASVQDARAFAERNAAWIAVRLKRLPETIPFAHGAILRVRAKDPAISELVAANWRKARLPARSALFKVAR